MTPLPDRFGPYRVLEVLGRGGMGVVYRVEDPGTRERYALKTLPALEGRTLFHIQREIHVLSQLRHPGIIRIFDKGWEGDVPWYTMELLEGLSLRERCGAPHVGAEALDPFLDLLCLLASALSFLHGEGLVHRDLTPDNILIREDGTPVLTDFGLASWFRGRQSREVFYAAEGAAGTAAYMAPEQILGQHVDARADLYSLGCILYEIVTGEPPFTGSKISQVLRGHLHRAPLPPSVRVEGLSSELNDLILRLLAKQPRERPGHAGDVAALLGARQTWLYPKPSPYLYRPGFAGRQELLRSLYESLDRLEEGEGGALFLGGESGVGKTRLAMEMAQEAERRDIAVYVGGGALDAVDRAPWGGEAGGPLSPLRPLLQGIAARCREQGREETEALLGRRGKVLAFYEPSLAGLPGQDDYPAPAELPTDAARLRLFRYLAETFLALAQRGPFVLFLDDLHWADPLTLDLLQYLLAVEELWSAQVLLVGMYRAEEAPEALPGLLEHPGVRRWLLPRLEEEIVLAIAGDMLALTPPGELSRYLYQQSEGNPLFLAEYLRAVLEEGLLSRHPGGGWQITGDEEVYQSLSLPGTLRELIGRRLEGLSRESRRLLEAAAVLGRELDGELLGRMASKRRDGGSWITPLHDLLRRQLLEEVPSGLLRFSHDKIREVAYEAMAPGRRRRWHHKAATLLERSLDLAEGESLARLGDHWKRAGEAERARTCYLSGARQEIARYAHGTAGRLLREYLALVEGPSLEGVSARNQLARDVLARAGEIEKAREELGRAREEARALGEEAAEVESLEGLAEIARMTGGLMESSALWEEALSLHRRRGDKKAEARALASLASPVQDMGRLDEAERLLSDALSLQRALQDRAGEAATLSSLAGLRWYQGHLKEVKPLYEESLALYRACGDRPAEGRVLGNLGGILHTLGLFDEAEDFWEQGLAIHREVGSRRNEGLLLGNLATSLHSRGRVEDARPLYQQALAIHREVGNKRSEALTLDRLGTIAQQHGQLEEARSFYRRALDTLRRLGDQIYWPHTMLALAGMERRLAGDFAESARLVAEAERAIQKKKDPLGLALSACQRGHLALARGETAKPMLAEAEENANRAGLSGESEVGVAIASLKLALAAFEAGEPLFRGEHPSEIPETMRAGLALLKRG